MGNERPVKKTKEDFLKPSEIYQEGRDVIETSRSFLLLTQNTNRTVPSFRNILDMFACFILNLQKVYKSFTHSSYLTLQKLFILETS